MTLVEQLRAQGLAMGTEYPSMGGIRTVIGWTTDEAKAEAARKAGATLCRYESSDPECNGWEIVVREVLA